MEEKSEMPQAVGTVATATSVETNANQDEPEERAVLTKNPDEPVSTKLTDEITSDPTNGINPPLSDEEDEGIGNGETQSEKDGDTPAELKQDILQVFNFINVLLERFSNKILVPKNFKPKTQLCNFWHQNFAQKITRVNY